MSHLQIRLMPGSRALAQDHCLLVDPLGRGRMPDFDPAVGGYARRAIARLRHRDLRIAVPTLAERSGDRMAFRIRQTGNGGCP